MVSVERLRLWLVEVPLYALLSKCRGTKCTLLLSAAIPALVVPLLFDQDVAKGLCRLAGMHFFRDGCIRSACSHFCQSPVTATPFLSVPEGRCFRSRCASKRSFLRSQVSGKALLTLEVLSIFVFTENCCTETSGKGWQ